MPSGPARRRDGMLVSESWRHRVISVVPGAIDHGRLSPSAGLSLAPLAGRRRRVLADRLRRAQPSCRVRAPRAGLPPAHDGRDRAQVLDRAAPALRPVVQGADAGRAYQDHGGHQTLGAAEILRPRHPPERRRRAALFAAQPRRRNEPWRRVGDRGRRRSDHDRKGAGTRPEASRSPRSTGSLAHERHHTRPEQGDPALWRSSRDRWRRFRASARRDPRPGRRERRRKVDADQGHGRGGHAHLRDNDHRRSRGRAEVAARSAPARHRHGVPGEQPRADDDRRPEPLPWPGALLQPVARHLHRRATVPAIVELRRRPDGRRSERSAPPRSRWSRSRAPCCTRQK